MTRAKTKISAGDDLDYRELATMTGATASVPQPPGLTHLQFRRFAGPICDLHIHNVTSRIAEISDDGITEVVVFHSTNEELLKYQSNLPFAVIGDPGKLLYQEFGLESSPRAFLHPGFLRAAPSVLANFLANRKRRHQPPTAPTGERGCRPIS